MSYFLGRRGKVWSHYGVTQHLLGIRRWEEGVVMGTSCQRTIVTIGYSAKTNFTINNLLYGVDVMLEMTWLQEADPLIRWNTGIVYMPDFVSSFQRIVGQWLDKQVKIGTAKVLSTNEQLESLKQPSNVASLESLNSKIWGNEDYTNKKNWSSSHAQGVALTTKSLELHHPSFGVLKVQKLNDNVALPKRSIAGAAGYDLCASQNCTIPAEVKGLVQTGLLISFPTSLYARIATKPRLALKRFIDVGAGAVDSNYRGEVAVVLFNH